MAGDFELRKDAKGEWFWTLQAENNRTLAKSMGSFKSCADCLHAIRSVKSIAPTGLVFDMTGPTRKMIGDQEVK
jgi:uncharacterized protein YegP (UPF0339 family)